jgi:hypothetical protein
MKLVAGRLKELAFFALSAYTDTTREDFFKK